MTLHWLAHCLSISQLAILYETGKSTAVCIVHDTIFVLKQHLVPASIKFPKDEELGQVIHSRLQETVWPYAMWGSCGRHVHENAETHNPWRLILVLQAVH